MRQPPHFSLGEVNATMRPVEPRVQNYATQTGVLEPLFTWKYGPGCHRQAAYRVAISRDGVPVADTGRICVIPFYGNLAALRENHSAVAR